MLGCCGVPAGRRQKTDDQNLDRRKGPGVVLFGWATNAGNNEKNTLRAIEAIVLL
jgi:hypothetical protein